MSLTHGCKPAENERVRPHNWTPFFMKGSHPLRHLCLIREGKVKGFGVP